jgi:hypothetical protein
MYSQDFTSLFNPESLDWLLQSGEPWTRYRTMTDLLHYSENDPAVVSARKEMVMHPQVQALVSGLAEWGRRPIQRHNDSSHPIYKLSTLADFGLRLDDPGIVGIIETILDHQSSEGAFQSWVNIAEAFGGTGEDQWSWILCDAPTVLYALQALGVTESEPVKRALSHLAGLVSEVGWECVAAPELGKFRGPGRKGAPCPIANVLALKALSLSPEYQNSPAAQNGVEMLMQHWENRVGLKIYLFGIGTDFHKLKYPFIWYDILHVVEVLSRFSFAKTDHRFLEMVSAITAQANTQGQYIAGSMYMPWKGWSFADKKIPSPWLTFLVLKIQHRLGFV